MKKENNQKKISEKVVSEIEKKEIKMKPKIYFIIRSVLFIGLIFFFLLFLLYIGSLIVFVFRANSILHFHGMGFCALKSVILSFPWYLVFLAVILIISIEIISSRIKFVYRKPLLYSLFVIIFLTVIGSVLVEKSSVHQHLYSLAQQEKMPVMGRMYKNLGNLDIENAHSGKILEKKEEHWVMETDDGDIVFLKINKDTKGRRIYLEVKEGDSILVVGEMENGLIDVFAFKRINGRLRINER